MKTQFRFFAIMLSLFSVSAFANTIVTPSSIVKAYYAALDAGNVSEVEKLLDGNSCIDFF